MSRKSTLIFIERTVTKAEAPILWPPDVKSQLTGKDPYAWKDWRQKKSVVEDKMVRFTILSELWEIVKDREGWCAVVLWVSKSR